ncbi:hypothetical protein DSL72_003805 [Monilinia vaccinii-corymbosi]|uniref:BTB domain-containing protein n=1 Tax=Monilinia vaccinii-corymbosi TaxID=61207 RepID=A0A8A3NXR7_9HELO|nr:hypothetical protein DSL72_003805 [Monilinia vaccinii-corymbosi]
MKSEASSGVKREASGSTSSERIEAWNSDAAKRHDPRTKAPPHCPQKPPTESYIKMIMGPKVNIVVGPEKKAFELPRELLSHYSPVFDRAFNGPFIEGRTQKWNYQKRLCRILRFL